ncbi:DUF58 domain-containing protein [Marinibaculum pumilum]|uniref:DUF58 domain-containing protein n=1 Tax=Marinibaculum pumilum TaxID=1766165 RepID=A0ABV7L5K5_9PROT
MAVAEARAARPAGPHLAWWGEDTGLAASLKELVALEGWTAGLTLPPVRQVLSRQAGAYRSPFRGRGMEFAEVRAYVPGDDVRSIDWKVTARRGRTHTKLFHEERDRPVLLFADLRPQMQFGSRLAFKSVVAARAAALAGWVALKQGDRIGGLVVAGGAHRELPPQRDRRQLMRLLHALSDATAPAGADSQDGEPLHRSLRRLRRVTRPGSLVLLFSDFHDLDAAAADELMRLGRHAEGMAFLVHDPLEAAAPRPGRYRVTEGGGGGALAVLRADDARWRRAYEGLFAARRQALAEACRKGGLAFRELSTVDDPAQALAGRPYRAIAGETLPGGAPS